MGSDVGELLRLVRGELISIHAPAWGATCFVCGRGQSLGHFNPRSRMGSDGFPDGWTDIPYKDFNPRSRMGSDLMSIVYTDGTREFQSTLPHGERLQ